MSNKKYASPKVLAILSYIYQWCLLWIGAAIGLETSIAMQKINGMTNTMWVLFILFVSAIAAIPFGMYVNIYKGLMERNETDHDVE